MIRQSVIFAAIFSIFLSAFGPSAMAADPTAHEWPRTVTVRGEGSISVKPDLAVITFGTLSQSPQVAAALEANNQSMRKLLDSIKKFGVADKDVQTSGFNVSPRYERGRRGRIVGYSVRNSLTVKLRDLSKVGELISIAMGQGANQLHGFRFVVEKTPERLDELRRAAVKDAARKAKILVESAGLKIGRAIRIAEGSALVPVRRARVAMGGSGSSSVPVAPGESELRLFVTVVFEIE